MGGLDTKFGGIYSGDCHLRVKQSLELIDKLSFEENRNRE